MSPDEIEAAARALLEGERNLIANLANLASLIYHSLPELNWAGFYLFDGNELILGPFQGKPGCTRIALGKGVCGTAAAKLETQVIADVHTFPGHIACDAASAAEIVVPLVRNGKLIAVLDLDSPRPGRFGVTDQALLEKLARMVCQASD